MAHIENECTVLNIDVSQFKTKLESLGAKNKGEFFQRRYVYDFNPIRPNSWIRLRTNGVKTTIAIKELLDEQSIGGTRELELVVEDFDTANELLEELGYTARNYQENYRCSYELNGVSIEIDTWPLIPTYAEIEGASESEVMETLKLLDVDLDQVTTMGVESIYRVVYGIDSLKIKELKLNESVLELNKHL